MKVEKHVKEKSHGLVRMSVSGGKRPKKGKVIKHHFRNPMVQKKLSKRKSMLEKAIEAKLKARGGGAEGGGGTDGVIMPNLEEYHE